MLCGLEGGKIRNPIVTRQYVADNMPGMVNDGSDFQEVVMTERELLIV